MCRAFITNFSCGHRFTSTKTLCFYEAKRHEDQSRCRLTTLCYSRWDENGETHCQDCREEIRKAREGRILTAKREQLQAYELGIAEYMQDIDEHEAEFRRLEAEEDDSLAESSSLAGGGPEDSGEISPLTKVVFAPNPPKIAAGLPPYTPNENETLEIELSSFEKEMLNYQKLEDWIKRIESDWKEEWTDLTVKLVKAKAEPVVDEEILDTAGDLSQLDQRVELMRNRIDAGEEADKNGREAKLTILRSLFAEAREQTDKHSRAQKLMRLQTLFAEARAKAPLPTGV